MLILNIDLKRVLNRITKNTA